MTTDRRTKTGAKMKAEVLEKLNTFSEANRKVAHRMHELILEADPSLCPRLWYGMPGYAKTKDSAVLVFFREDEKYMTFGLTENVDLVPQSDATDLLMPTAWFLTKLDDATEKRVVEIVQQATK